MLRLIVIILLSGYVLQLQAQTKVQYENPGVDTLHVVFHKDSWAIEHKVLQGETLFMLSQKYHVPPVLLTEMNDLDFQASLKGGEILFIPFGPYNQAKAEPVNRYNARPLYYIVKKYDNLYRLAHLAGVQQKTIQQWNGMPDNYIEEGDRLFVGWVLYSAAVENTGNTVSNTGRLKSKYIDNDQVDKTETVVIRKVKHDDTLTAIERKYNEQTRDGLVTTEEKGTAVFYTNKGKLNSTNTFFAFHNSAKPGTIIKVFNPGTNKTVFVKVLGPVPNTKMYYNSIIGISSGAKAALLVTEDKAWCELQYAP